MARPQVNLNIEIPTEIWTDGLKRIFESVGVVADDLQRDKIFYYIISTLGQYLRNHPDHFFRLGYVDIFKSIGTREEELYRVKLNSTKKIPNAQFLFDFYTQGGLESEILSTQIKEFLEGLTEYAVRKETETKEKIIKLQRQRSYLKSVKEKRAKKKQAERSRRYLEKKKQEKLKNRESEGEN